MSFIRRKRNPSTKTGTSFWLVWSILFALPIFFLSPADARGDSAGCLMQSDFLKLPEVGQDLAFCARWNPDFSFKGSQCCGRVPWKYRRRGIKCAPNRSKQSFCDEMTDEQRRYLEAHRKGEIGDVLELIGRNRQGREIRRDPAQAYCSYSNGFLANGRPIVPTAGNRIRLRRPERCVHFGTDPMVGMLEWLGREVASEYSSEEFSGVHLLVGDISAPRGGCLAGRGGRRGHASHTNGQDVDLGFLYADSGKRSPASFSRFGFDGKLNWWLVKKMFKNPFACVKVIFLDHRHIARLKRVAQDDPEWGIYGPHIRHVRNHKNHFHVRIGEGPGPAGCTGDDMDGIFVRSLIKSST